MKAFLILSNNNTKELSVMSKKDYHANVQNIYNYEPLSSTDTMEDANLLKDHINQLAFKLTLIILSLIEPVSTSRDECSGGEHLLNVGVT